MADAIDIWFNLLNKVCIYKDKKFYSADVLHDSYGRLIERRK